MGCFGHLKNELLYLQEFESNLNAIYNATGAWIIRVPALPEVVLAALKDLEK